MMIGGGGGGTGGGGGARPAGPAAARAGAAAGGGRRSAGGRLGGSGGGGGSTTGGVVSERMQAAMSKNMNSSTFSWGDRSVVVQPLGKGALTWSPEETWMSLLTTRPHWFASGAPIGVLKLKYWVVVGHVVVVWSSRTLLA